MNRSKLFRLRRRSQRGLAVVEFALTMPLVLFLLIATAEVGRALYQYTALTKAVRDGARFLAERSIGASGVLNLSAADLILARNLTVFGNINGTGTPVLPGLSIGTVTANRVGTTDFVQVTASYTFDSVFSPIPTFGYGDPISITTFTATAVQRNLR